ncbi:hypothetical protein GQ457_02G021790 [Hibiscus cannabinus]
MAVLTHAKSTACLDPRKSQCHTNSTITLLSAVSHLIFLIEEFDALSQDPILGSYLFGTLGKLDQYCMLSCK